MYELEWVFYYTSIVTYGTLLMLIFYHLITYIIRKINKKGMIKNNDLNGDDYVI